MAHRQRHCPQPARLDDPDSGRLHWLGADIEAYIAPQFFATPAARLGFPRTRTYKPSHAACARLRKATALRPELVMEFVEHRGAVALARSFTGERAIEHRLDTDRPQDTHHLPLKRLAQRI